MRHCSQEAGDAALKALFDRGLIPAATYHAVEAMRGIGNAGAHGDMDLTTGADLEPTTAADADAACTVTVALVTHLFVTPALVEDITRKFPAK